MEVQTKPNMIYLKDYRVPDFLIDSIHLHIDLNEELTTVKSVIAIRRNPTGEGRGSNSPPPLILNGEDMQLMEVKLNGHTLSATDYQVDAETLTIPQAPDQFTLETVVHIKPQENTRLTGLYKSRENFCTQCEANGFRRITYFPDRPDVMSRFTTTISADKTRYPMLLSNGNLIETRDLPNNRHWVHWEDPSLKPCYLFALVAGDFDLLEDTFTTMSGKKVALKLYLERGYADQGNYALQALKTAMRWDEQAFGREYDLDIYMVVAVSDFNMGAMENKGLNIFNTKYILAKPETATDLDFLNVLRVIGHEYFHNWSGNRITCRDWFQITLKEGLTVCREQAFMTDQASPALARIDEVNLIRNHQFLEDSGPNAHPIRPEAYIEVNNFYTTTVYHKGSEVIGMIATILGKQGFRQGMDLYFSRHDGQAVTTEDFVQAMADSSGRDFTQFKRWYRQAGTPKLDVNGQYDAVAKQFVLTVKQSCPPTPEQPHKDPLHIPLAMGLVNADGKDMPLQLEGDVMAKRDGRVLELTQAEEKFVFINVMDKPIPSLLRNFSAPVKLEYPYLDNELAHLFKHDTDAVTRWDAGQQLMTRLLLQEIDRIEQGQTATPLPSVLVEAFSHILTSDITDYHLVPRLIGLPAELYLSQQRRPAPIMSIHLVRQAFRHGLAAALAEPFLCHYENLHQVPQDSNLAVDAMARRGFKNACLFYLVAQGQAEYAELAYQQFKQSLYMTDCMGALVALNDSASPLRQQALDEFYQKWQHEPLLINKWLLLQATSALASTPKQVQALLEHPAFSIKNPNNVYALICGFGGNMVHFHAHDGSGYQFTAEQVLKIDGMNPQVAARVIAPLTHWQGFDAARQQLMRQQLQRILQKSDLSKDVFELATKSLEFKGF